MIEIIGHDLIHRTDEWVIECGELRLEGLAEVTLTKPEGLTKENEETFMPCQRLTTDGFTMIDISRKGPIFRLIFSPNHRMLGEGNRRHTEVPYGSQNRARVL
jgi:hypothetical protein